MLLSSCGVRVLLRGAWAGEQQWFQGDLGGAAVAPGLCSMPGDSGSLEYTGLGSGAKTQLQIYIVQMLVVWGLQGGGPNPRCPSAPQFPQWLSQGKHELSAEVFVTAAPCPCFGGGQGGGTSRTWHLRRTASPSRVLLGFSLPFSHHY